MKQNVAAKFIAPSPVSDEEPKRTLVPIEANVNRARCHPNNVAVSTIWSNVGINHHHTFADTKIVIFWHANLRFAEQGIID
jgi:hypothetical protein